MNWNTHGYMHRLAINGKEKWNRCKSISMDERKRRRREKVRKLISNRNTLFFNARSVM